MNLIKLMLVALLYETAEGMVSWYVSGDCLLKASHIVANNNYHTNLLRYYGDRTKLTKLYNDLPDDKLNEYLEQEGFKPLLEVLNETE